MPQNENKLNRLEELKNKLGSRNYRTKIEHRDGFSHRGLPEVADSWEESDTSGPEAKFFMNTPAFKKLFTFSLAFFAFTLLYAAYVFIAGSNTVSNDNIEISVLGNNFTAGGEDLDLVVGIKNRNSSPLELADLVVEYPGGGTLENDTERIRQTLGTIPAGAVRNENLRLVLFGEQGSVRPIKIILEYRVSGSNAIFVKEETYNVNINSTPINLSVDAPTQVSPNQSLTLNVKTTQNATRAAEKILVKIDYPAGFQFTEATPAPSHSNSVWSLGDLAPGAQFSIAISGKMMGAFEGEEKTFIVSTGSQSPSNKYEIGVVFNTVRHTVRVEKPFIENSLYINGVSESEYAVDSKTPLNVEVKYSNNMNTRVDDLRIRAKLSGNAFDRKTIKAQRGFYDSATDTIIWDKNYQSDMKEVNPGESGSVTFEVAPLPLFSNEGGLLTEPVVRVDVDMEGSQSVEGTGGAKLENTSQAVVRLISDVGFIAKALHYSGPLKNSGPIPPKVGQKTTYTILWTLSNTSNSISGAQVNSTLPPWVEFEGAISPEGENIAYNASSKSIEWKADRIAKGAGITVPARTVAFQVSVKPSASQVGKSPVLINSAVLTGKDDFAKVNVRASQGSLTTRPENDPGFPDNGGSVSE